MSFAKNSPSVDFTTVGRNYFKIALSILLFFIVGLLYLSAANKYPGKFASYLLFTLSYNALLWAGFRKNRLFFDTFIGIYLWIGFWLKFTLRFIFFNGEFNEFVGFFDPDINQSWDLALNVSSCGAIGLLLATFLREKFLFKYPTNVIENRGLENLFQFYQKYRTSILSSFVLIIFIFAASNVYFGIYQRGIATRTILPFGLGGVFTWLLLFGFSSFAATFLSFEFRIKKNPYLVTLIVIFESFISNLSLLSRGMILNLSAMGLGSIAYRVKRSFSIKDQSFKFFSLATFGIFFVASILIVNIYRGHFFFDETDKGVNASGPIQGGNTFANFHKTKGQASTEGAKNTVNLTKTLIIDRFVGIEGVMAVSSYPETGWDLWKLAWAEKFAHTGTSMYDTKIIHSTNTMVHSKYHFISLPGIIAFFFYPGSFVFLLLSMLFLGLFASTIEILTYKFCETNLILCSLFAQVIAYRFSNFGYVPAQSYLLIAALILNILLIKLLNRLFKI